MEGMLHVEDVFHFNKRIWIIMDIMNADFQSFCEEWSENYSENVVKYIIKKSLIPLSKLHKLNIIHRDIKSNNILYNHEGEIVLMDFGVSRTLTQNKR